MKEPTPPHSPQQRGQQAEERAAQWLLAEGWQVVARNERWGWAEGRGRPPEVDILARRQGVLWVLEVKSRQSLPPLGAPLLSQVQRRRLYWAAMSLGPQTQVGLLWVGADSAVEFIENP